VCPNHHTARRESGDEGTIRRSLGDLLANDPVVSKTDGGDFIAHQVSHLGDPPEVYAKIRLVNLGLEAPGLEMAREPEVGGNQCGLGA